MMKKTFVFVLLIFWFFVFAPIFSDQDKNKGIKNELTGFNSAESPFDFESQWALIIGINQYSYYDNLRHAQPEATAVKELLKAYSQDNPYSNEDERLRKYAAFRIPFWRDYKEGRETIPGIDDGTRSEFDDDVPIAMPTRIVKISFFPYIHLNEGRELPLLDEPNNKIKSRLSMLSKQWEGSLDFEIKIEIKDVFDNLDFSEWPTFFNTGCSQKG
jgi:hypothetical protein